MAEKVVDEALDHPMKLPETAAKYRYAWQNT
jgi:hypothetical protein